MMKENSDLIPSDAIMTTIHDETTHRASRDEASEQIEERPMADMLNLYQHNKKSKEKK